MKRFMSFLFCLSIISGCFNTQTHNPQPILLEQNRPSQPLLTLLALLNIQHDSTLADIVAKTQKAWLRTSGERWDIANKHQDKTEQIFELFDKMGILDEIRPQHKSYDYVIIMGAALPRMRTRLKHAIDLAHDGIHFDNIILLAGERPINEKIEPQETFFDRNNPQLPIKANWQKPQELPKTEYDLMRMIFDQAELPESWKNVSIHVVSGNEMDPKIDYESDSNIIFINTPMQETTTGTKRRPNTGDTVKTWLASHPKTGRCLVISNQPYIGYQQTVTESLLPEALSCETVGKQSTTENIGVHLDNLARWLYMENKRSS